MTRLQTSLIILLTLCSVCVKSQVIVLKEFSGYSEFPKAEIFKPDQWSAFLTYKDYDTIPHIYKDRYFYILVPESYAVGKDTIRISTTTQTYKVTGDLKQDTIDLGTVYYISNNSIKDVWYKYDDYEYYQKLYAEERVQYNSDSTCYCKRMYKGEQHDYDEPFNFSFYKSGTWECYDTLSRLIARYNYGAHENYEGSFYAEFKDQNLIVKGHHKDGAQSGEWIVKENGKEFRQTFFRREVVFVVR